MKLLDRKWREALRAALSVALAIVAARACSLPDVWWAAFSAFMVARPGFQLTLERGVYRNVGTIAGAIAATVIATILIKNVALFVFFVFVISGVTLYFAILSRHGYGWLFAGLTAEMILAYALFHPGQIISFATIRIGDVAVGTLSALIVSFAFSMLAREPRIGPHAAWHGILGTSSATQAPISVAKRYLVIGHSIEGAIAIAALSFIGFQLKLESFGQASITVLAVMIVPHTQVAENRHLRVSSKLVWRSIGCLIGGATGIGAMFLASLYGWSWWWLLMAGVCIGQRLQDGPEHTSYFGTQFCLGFLTAYVHDTHLLVSNSPAIERFLGITCGCVALWISILCSRALTLGLSRTRKSRVRTKQIESSIVHRNTDPSD